MFYYDGNKNKIRTFGGWNTVWTLASSQIIYWFLYKERVLKTAAGLHSICFSFFSNISNHVTFVFGFTIVLPSPYRTFRVYVIAECTTLIASVYGVSLKKYNPISNSMFELIDIMCIRMDISCWYPNIKNITLDRYWPRYINNYTFFFL